ncbi:hypothetical protein TWF718_007131 [Orbilia javanica]|uniref:Uncharacterized protein n=1 Tax=Orbilia javanica TaxID=47235 RepID=A0AAN8RI96_9PEZI
MGSFIVQLIPYPPGFMTPEEEVGISDIEASEKEFLEERALEERALSISNEIEAKAKRLDGTIAELERKIKQPPKSNPKAKDSTGTSSLEHGGRKDRFSPHLVSNPDPPTAFPHWISKIFNNIRKKTSLIIASTKYLLELREDKLATSMVKDQILSLVSTYEKLINKVEYSIAQTLEAGYRFPIEHSDRDDESGSTTPSDDGSSLAEIFSGMSLGFRCDEKKAPQDLSKMIESQTSYLSGLRFIVDIFGKQPPNITIHKIKKYAYLDTPWGKRYRAEYALTEVGLDLKETTYKVKTSYGTHSQTGGLLRVGRFRNDTITVSGSAHEEILGSDDRYQDKPSIVERTEYDEPHHGKPEVRRPCYSHWDLQKWGKELSQYLGIEYEKSLLEQEHYHVEKKQLVNFLVEHRLWYPAEKGALPKVNNTKRDVLRFYLTQQPCKPCQVFMERVAKEFGLCIGWHNHTSDYNDISMTYAVNFYGLLVHFTWSPPVTPNKIQVKDGLIRRVELDQRVL